MFRRLITTSALAATVLLVAVAVASARTEAMPALTGTVGPGFTISLKSNGKAVKTLKAGTYKFVIADKASIHDFSLQRGSGGPQVLTTVPFVGTKTALVTLKAGKYKYYCQPHESSMFGFFTVK
jgi:plastocyanin